VLEEAVRQLAASGAKRRVEMPLSSIAHDLARLDVADVAPADRVERARLAGDAPVPSAVFPIASGRTPHGSRQASMRSGTGTAAERALQMLAARAAADRRVQVRRLGQQVNDDFRVGRALEDVAQLLVLAAEHAALIRLPLCATATGPHRILPQQRLRVAQFAEPVVE
jgi:hypothetical protein